MKKGINIQIEEPYPKFPCPQTPSLLAGGCYRGLVCWWDERAGGLAAGHSEFEQSHSDVVYTLRWAELGAGIGDIMVLWQVDR